MGYLQIVSRYLLLGNLSVSQYAMLVEFEHFLGINPFEIVKSSPYLKRTAVY